LEGAFLCLIVTKFIVSFPISTERNVNDYVLDLQIYVSHVKHTYPCGNSARHGACQGQSAFAMLYVTVHKIRHYNKFSNYITRTLTIYFSPIIIRVIKSRKIRLAGHVASMGERRSAYRVWVGKPERKKNNTWKNQA